MDQTLYVSTRKGLFTLVPDGDGYRVDRVDFLGEPVSLTFPDPRDGTVYAALRHGHFGVKLHRKVAGGAFREVAAPAFPAAAEPTEADPAVDAIWALEGTGPDTPGGLWCGTDPGALFRSTDAGESWELVETLWNRPERAGWFGGGADDPVLHSVCVDPRDPSHIVVGISCGGAWRTRDGGTTWALCATGMRAEYMPPDRADDPNIQDPHLIVQSPSHPDRYWTQHHNGVFQTRDGAETWTEVPGVQPSVFGFAVAVHPGDPDTAWFVPGVKDECRVPVDGELVVARTRDGGESFEVLRGGLPQAHAYDVVLRHALAVDRSGARLVFGSTTGNLFATADGGDSWTQVSGTLPPIYAVRFG